MHRRLALSIALLSPAALAQDGEPLSETGTFFKIVCHFPNKDVAAEALRTVEGTWPIAAKLYGAPKQKPDAPFAVHLYRNAEQYKAATQKDEEGSLAFADAEAGAAHVAVQPELTDATLHAVGLSYPTRRLLARVAARLTRVAVMPNHRFHPHWFVDGSALWVEAEAMRAQKQLTSTREDPYFSTCMNRSKLLQKRMTLPDPAGILDGKTSDFDDKEDRRAVRWLFFDFLADKKNASKLAKVIAELQKLGDDAGDADKLRKMLQKQLRPDRLEKPFAKFVQDLDPLWTEQAGSLQAAGDAWVHVAEKEQSAFVNRLEEAGYKPYTVTGKLTILPAESAQMNLTVGNSGGGFLMVAFMAGYGVALWEYTAAGQWNSLGEWKDVPIEVHKPVAFEAAWLKSRDLVLRVDGKEVFRKDFTRDMNGAYGLSVQAGSAGTWQDVRLER